MNEAVVIGTNLSLNCSPNNLDANFTSIKCLKWFRYNHDCNTLDTVCVRNSSLFDNSPYITNLNYSVILYETSSTLYISTNNLTNANSYYCVCHCCRGVSAVVADSLDVVIMTSDPKCLYKKNVTSENSSLEIICLVNVSGSWLPQFKWRNSDGIELISILTNRSFQINTTDTRNSTKAYQVTSELNLVADNTMNLKTFECMLYNWIYVGNYDAVKKLPNDVNATNVPSYSYSWISSPANILYIPRDITITNTLEYLECKSRGNPLPTIRWDIPFIKNISDNPLHKRVFNETGKHIVTCYAENIIEGKYYIAKEQYIVEINMIFIQKKDVFPQKEIPIIFGCIGGLLAIIILIVTCVVLKKRYYKTKSNSSLNDNNKIIDPYAMSSDVGGSQQSINYNGGSYDKLEDNPTYFSNADSGTQYSQVNKIKTADPTSRVNDVNKKKTQVEYSALNKIQPKKEIDSDGTIYQIVNNDNKLKNPKKKKVPTATLR